VRVVKLRAAPAEYDGWKVTGYKPALRKVSGSRGALPAVTQRR